MGGGEEYTGWERTWPRVVVDCDTDTAVPLLRDYYSKRRNGAPRYSGSHFETIAARNTDPSAIGPDEFTAISLLGVSVTGHAALRMLSQGYEIGELLAQVPNTDIVDADPESLRGGTAPASRLWKLLRSGRDGFGRTTTSKLMAAKRPKLISIWDSFIEHATGLDTHGYWRRFQTVPLANDKRIRSWLSELRGEVPDVPPLSRRCGSST